MHMRPKGTLFAGIVVAAALTIGSAAPVLAHSNFSFGFGLTLPAPVISAPYYYPYSYPYYSPYYSYPYYYPGYYGYYGSPYGVFRFDGRRDFGRYRGYRRHWR